MFEFEYKGDREESLSPVLLTQRLKEQGIDILEVKLYRKDKLITLADFNYYLDIYVNMI